MCTDDCGSDYIKWMFNSIYCTWNSNFLLPIKSWYALLTQKNIGTKSCDNFGIRPKLHIKIYVWIVAHSPHLAFIQGIHWTIRWAVEIIWKLRQAAERSIDSMAEWCVHIGRVLRYIEFGACNGTPELSTGDPKKLIGRVVQCRQYRVGFILMGKLLICTIGRFEATDISNVLSKCVLPIHLAHKVKNII